MGTMKRWGRALIDYSDFAVDFGIIGLGSWGRRLPERMLKINCEVE